MKKVLDLETGEVVLVPVADNEPWYSAALDVVDRTAPQGLTPEFWEVAHTAALRVANFGRALSMRAALELAFREGEHHGRALVGLFDMQQSRFPNGCEGVTAEQLREAGELEEREFAEFMAEHWHPGCDRPLTVVVCELCGSEHSVISASTRQGVDCCAWTRLEGDELYLEGGYGSAVADMSRYRLVEPSGDRRDFLVTMLTKRPGVGPDSPCVGVDPVCDGCILRMLSEGILVEDGDCEP